MVIVVLLRCCIKCRSLVELNFMDSFYCAFDDLIIML